MNQESEEHILGIHLWKGAAANFNMIARIIIISPSRLNSRFKDTLIRIRMDPNVWAKKYLREASPLLVKFEFRIIGINTILFSSKANQHIKNLGLDIMIKTLKVSVKINKTNVGEMIVGSF